MSQLETLSLVLASNDVWFSHESCTAIKSRAGVNDIVHRTSTQSEARHVQVLQSDRDANETVWLKGSKNNMNRNRDNNASRSSDRSCLCYCHWNHVPR